MPLDFQPVQVVLEGLDQKTDAKLRAPGKLASAINVEFDKIGALNKRRGYRRVVLGPTTHGTTDEGIFSEAAVYQGELVIFGEEWLYSVGAIGADIDNASVTPRGPIVRGSYRVVDIVSAGIGDG